MLHVWKWQLYFCIFMKIVCKSGTWNTHLSAFRGHLFVHGLLLCSSTHIQLGSLLIFMALLFMLSMRAEQMTLKIYASVQFFQTKSYTEGKPKSLVSSVILVLSPCRAAKDPMDLKLSPEKGKREYA